MNDKIRMYGMLELSKKQLSALELPRGRQRDVDYLREVGNYDGAQKLIEITRLFTDNNETYNLGYKKPEFGAGFVKLEINPNKIVGYIPGQTRITYKQFQDSISEVQELIIDKGLDIDIRDLTVYSYHNCIDLPLNDKYEAYFPYINSINGINKKTEKRAIETTVYLSGMKNVNEAIAIYDKSKEWNLNHSKKLTIPLMRIEHKIEKLAKSKRFCLADITEDKYKLAYYESREIIEKYVIPEPDKITHDMINRLSLLQYFFIENMGMSKNEVLKHIARIHLNDIMGVNIAKAIGLKRDNPNYKRFNGFIRDMEKIRPIDPELIGIYSDLRNIFKRVA